MKLDPLFRMQIDLGKRYPIGIIPKGRRTIVSISGGEVSGPDINGEVMPFGGDSELIDAEGVYHVDARVMIKTDDGANIYVQYFGILKPSAILAKKMEQNEVVDFGDGYFVTQPRFETSHEKYSWLDNVMAVAEGRVSQSGVDYLVYACTSDNAVGLARAEEIFGR